MRKVSIIIPVYNVEKYLPECLESVICQTLEDIEIICINDASTDQSLSILRLYEEKEKRISIIQLTENKGLAYVRNRGIECAKGKYIYFLDSDDMIEKNAMEILYDEAEKKSLDGIFFDAKLIYEKEEYLKKFKQYMAVHNGVYEGVKHGRELFEEFVINKEWTCSVPRQFWKRNFLVRNQLTFFEGIIHEDVAFAFMAIMLANRVEYIRDRLFIRRFREESIMTSALSDKNFYGYFTAYYLVNSFAFQKGVDSNVVKKYLATLYGTMDGLYEALKEKYDLGKGLRNTEIKNAYYFFVSQKNKYMAYGDFSTRAIRQIKSYKKVYIYGAGVVAKSVYEGLVKKDIVVQGFIVSEPDDNLKVFWGRPVIAFDKINAYEDNIFIIIAVSGGYQKEIKEKLIGTKWNYIVYDEIEEKYK